MKEKLVLPEKEIPLRKAWKAWKGVALAASILAFLLRNWLPGLIVAICYIIGIVVLINLGFHLLRYLKNRVFWRVRSRIIGAFIFVGLLPLLLIFGIIYLAAYLLMGQLSVYYLESSISGLEREITWINLELERQLHTPVSEAGLREAAGHVLKNYSGKFPRLAATLSRRKPDGNFEIIGHHDPTRIWSDLSAYPAGKWLGNQASFEGLLEKDTAGMLTSLRPVASLPGCFLEVSALFDQQIETRLQREKEIYAAIAGFGHTSVEGGTGGIKVKINDSDKKAEAHFKVQIDDLEARRAGDKRWMTSYATVLECRDFMTGKKKAAALAVLHVPIQTLYATYFSGSFQLGKVVMVAIVVLLVIFAIAEIISVVIGVTISRRITRSVHDMYLGTLALQEGNLQHQIPVRRNDQLGLLAHSFNQMSGSITRLLEEVSEKKRLEQELEIAREVQATLFPKQLPHPRGLSLFGGCAPARVVSGDYYDFIHEDDARLHIVVGDISGKGISAALLMANLQAAMRNQVATFRKADPGEVERSLSEVMQQLNTQLFFNSPTEKYATLFTGRYDAETRCLCYCNAGHLPPILLCNGDMKRLEAGGTVLGLFQEAAYQAHSIELAPGTVLAMFTDGITEAVNGSEEEFGEDRLVESLRESRSRSPEAIYQHVTAQVRMWQGSLKQHDDITLIVAKVN